MNYLLALGLEPQAAFVTVEREVMVEFYEVRLHSRVREVEPALAYWAVVVDLLLVAQVTGASLEVGAGLRLLPWVGLVFAVHLFKSFQIFGALVLAPKYIVYAS